MSLLSIQDVIRQALIRGDLPLAHAYLLNKSINNNGQLLGDDNQPHDVTFNGILGVGLGFVMDALSKRNFEQASSILTQMVSCNVI